MEQYKVCAKCGRDRPLSEYRNAGSKKYPDQLRSECIDCTRLVDILRNTKRQAYVRAAARKAEQKRRDNMSEVQKEALRQKRRLRNKRKILERVCKS